MSWDLSEAAYSATRQKLLDSSEPNSLLSTPDEPWTLVARVLASLLLSNDPLARLISLAPGTGMPLRSIHLAANSTSDGACPSRAMQQHQRHHANNFRAGPLSLHPPAFELSISHTMRLPNCGAIFPQRVRTFLQHGFFSRTIPPYWSRSAHAL